MLSNGLAGGKSIDLRVSTKKILFLKRYDPFHSLSFATSSRESSSRADGNEFLEATPRTEEI